MTFKQEARASVPFLPLEGIRVLDLSMMVSGPLASQILGDQGASIFKVEPLSGDLARAYAGRKSGVSAVGASVLRNKRSLAIDLKQPEGVELVQRLAATCDVLLHNFRPTKLDKLGLDSKTLREKLDKEIVVCHISGYGADGPMSNDRVYDPIVQASSGLASIQANAQGRPSMVRLIIPDQITALTASQAISAALVRKDRTGKGSEIHINMLDTMVAFLWPEGMAAHTFPQDEVDNGATMKQTSFYVRDMVFETKDGAYITCGAVSDKEWRGLCQALNREVWLDDSRFSTAPRRMKNADLRFQLTEKAVQQFDADQVLKRLREADVPCAKIVHPRTELFTQPQIVHNQVIVESKHPHSDVGPVRFCRPPAQFQEFGESAPPAGLSRIRFLEHLQHAPLIGQHSREILAEIGVSPDELDRLQSQKIIRVSKLENSRL